MPTMAPSASGVSITRCSPNLARRPSVTRNTPPSTPMSSPRTRTSSSRSISCMRARLMAWTIVSFRCSVILGSSSAVGLDRSPVRGLAARSELPLELRALRPELRRRLGIDLLEAIEQVRLHPGLGALDRAPDLGLDLGLERRLAGGVEHALRLDVPLEPGEGLSRLPRLDLGLVPVLRGIVGRGVERQPVGQRFDQRGPLPASRPLDGLPRRHVAGEEVVTVDLDAGEPVGDRLLRERLGVRLLRARE